MSANEINSIRAAGSLEKLQQILAADFIVQISECFDGGYFITIGGVDVACLPTLPEVIDEAHKVSVYEVCEPINEICLERVA